MEHDRSIFRKMTGSQPRRKWRHGELVMLLGLVWLAVGAGPAAALEVEFQAWVDRTRSTQASPIRLTLSIQTDESIAHMPAPKVDLKDFHVEGPSVSTQTKVNIVNFKQTATYIRELTYTLYPRRTGRFTIGPARLELGGTVHQTKQIAVEIVRGSTRPGTGPSGVSADEPTGLEENLFVRATANRQQAYVGQQITVDYDLVYRFRLDNVGFKEIPSFSGFWIKELFVAQSLQNRREVIGGVPFNVAPLRRMALFPTRAGTHQVEPMAVSCDVMQQGRRSGSLFDGFFSDPFNRQNVLLRSEALEFEVLPLPEQGRPAEFTGAVGRFALDVQARPTTLPAGDPVSLRITVEGQGNMDAVRLPEIVVPAGIKVYDPEVTEEVRVENGLHGGRRAYEYILIPESGGMLEIPPIHFAYFDPGAGAYRVVRSEPIFINSQGTAAEEPEGYGLSRRDIQAVGEDIRYIKPDAGELGDSGFLYQSGIFWTLQGLVPLAFLGLLFHQRHHQRLEGDVAYARRRRARGEAGRRLKRARELLAEEQSAEFHAEIQRAVLAFLGDRLNLAAAGLTRDSCARALAEGGVEPKLIDRIGDLLSRCDFARFAQASASRAEMEQVRAHAEQIITRLEKAI